MVGLVLAFLDRYFFIKHGFTVDVLCDNKNVRLQSVRGLVTRHSKGRQYETGARTKKQNKMEAFGFRCYPIDKKRFGSHPLEINMLLQEFHDLFGEFAIKVQNGEET